MPAYRYFKEGTKVFSDIPVKKPDNKLSKFLHKLFHNYHSKYQVTEEVGAKGIWCAITSCTKCGFFR
jgi:hypothetical protein